MNSAPHLATGTNYVPRDMYARIHQGEAVVPARYNPAAGGRGGSPTVHISISQHIDARSDAAQVATIARDTTREGITAAFEELHAQGRI